MSPRASSVQEEDEPEFTTGRDALKSVSDMQGIWNWVLLGTNMERLEGGGSGSVNEMRDYLIRSKRLNAYGILRLTFGTGANALSKKIFIILSGSDLTSARQFLSHRPKMQEMAKAANTAGAVTLKNVHDLTIEVLIEKLRGMTQNHDVFKVQFFEEAERWRIAEEERRRQAREDARAALREAMRLRDPGQIERCLDTARQERVSPKLLSEAEAMQKLIGEIEAELRRDLSARSFGNLPVLIERARCAQMEHRPLVREAMRAISQLHVYEHRLDFPGDGKVGPKRTTVWLANPTIQMALEEPGDPADVWLRIERISGDPLFGFHVLRNPSLAPPLCPCVVPGAPVLEEARCRGEDFATAAVQVTAARQIFCVPSTADLTKEGGEARLLLTSTRRLSCLMLSDFRWPYEESFLCEWSDGDGTAGGERGRQSWFRNPTFRVYLESDREDKQVCIFASIAVAPGGPSHVSLHAVKNEYKLARSPHASIIGDSHQVLAEPEPRYQEGPTVGICFEVSKQDLAITGEAHTPPVFFVPSAQEQSAEGSFSLHMRSTARLVVQRITTTPQRGATAKQPSTSPRVADKAFGRTRTRASTWSTAGTGASGYPSAS